MDETNNDLTQPAQEADETIAKKVYDDMTIAWQKKFDEQEKQIKTLNKQVDDYSRILQNLNVVENSKPKTNSGDILKNILGGLK